MSEQAAGKSDPVKEYNPIESEWESSFTDPSKSTSQKIVEEASSIPNGTSTLARIMQLGNTNKDKFLTKIEIDALDNKVGATTRIRAEKEAERTAGEAGQTEPQGINEAPRRVAKGIMGPDMEIEGRILTAQELQVQMRVWSSMQREMDIQLADLAGSSKKREAIANIYDDKDKTGAGEPQEISVNDAKEYVSARLALFGLDYLQNQSKNIDTKYGNADGKLSDAELSKLIDAKVFDPLGNRELYGPLKECLTATRNELRKISGLDPNKAIYTQEEINKARQVLSKKLQGV